MVLHDDDWSDPPPIGKSTSKERWTRDHGFDIRNFTYPGMPDHLWGMMRMLELHSDCFLTRLHAWFPHIPQPKTNNLSELSTTEKNNIVQQVYQHSLSLTEKQHKDLQDRILTEMHYLWYLDSHVNPAPKPTQRGPHHWMYKRPWKGYDPTWITQDGVLDNVDKLWVRDSVEWHNEDQRIKTQAAIELAHLNLKGEFQVSYKIHDTHAQFLYIKLLRSYDRPIDQRPRSIAGLPFTYSVNRSTSQKGNTT